MTCLLITAVTEFFCAVSPCSYLGYQIFNDHLIKNISKGQGISASSLNDWHCFKISHCGPQGKAGYVFSRASGERWVCIFEGVKEL